MMQVVLRFRTKDVTWPAGEPFLQVLLREREKGGGADGAAGAAEGEGERGLLMVLLPL